MNLTSKKLAPDQLQNSTQVYREREALKQVKVVTAMGQL